MPVVTRNQSKMMNVKKANVPPSLILPQLAGLPQSPEPKVIMDTPKPHVSKNNLRLWFVNYTQQRLADVDKFNNKKREIKGFKTWGNDEKNFELRKTHFDCLRCVTEMYANINEYLPELVETYPDSFKKFVDVVYKKIQEIYCQLYSMESLYKPVTYEEFQITKSLVHTLEAAEKMVIPYLSSECSTKRKRTPVDYTGMDAIEPESEYDGITNIWYDNSIWYDSDYDPEEEEEDDDEFDVYLVDEVESIVGEEPEEDEYDYSEDEDYVPEEEEVVVIEDHNVFEIAVRVRAGRPDN